MKNSDLDHLLKRAKTPEPAPKFLEDLPRRVQRGIDRDLRDSNETPTLLHLLLRRAMPLAAAAACIILGFIWGANSRQDQGVQSPELAEARACWREVAALFPNQLQSIILDAQGSRVALSEKADQPLAAPIYLKLCDGKDCRRFITFSGQQIKVNGESFEVLIDRVGEVLLVGEAHVWNSANASEPLGAYKVFAQSLAKS